MKKLIILLVMLVSAASVTTLLAQEKERFSPIIAVSKEGKISLNLVNTIAIFLSGNDAFLTRIVEDALNIHLTNAGFTVVNRESLEQTFGEQLSIKRKQEAEGALNTLNALHIGREVHAGSILTGTVLIELSEQQVLLVKVASFQLIDVESGKTLISILFEAEKSKSFSEIAKEFVNILRKKMKME